MYFSYLDSSGRPDYTDPENFTVASVSVNEIDWYNVDKRLNEIKQRHFPNQELNAIEFHAKDMINRKGIYKHMSWDNIYSFLNDLFKFIALNETCLSIIATIIKKDALVKKIDMEEWNYRFILERLNEYLISQNNLLSQSNNPPQFGILILDSEGSKRDGKLRNKLKNILEHGTRYSKLDYLIEDPLFTDSKWRNLSQVTDCIAYCIRKKYRKNNANNMHLSYWEYYYSLIESKFYSKDGQYLGYGLKIFPK